MITDKFGCKLNEGDWVLYIFVDPQSITPSIRHGQIVRIVSADSWPGNFSFVEIADNEECVRPFRCVKFSQEEYTIRKLESENGQ